MKIDALVMEDKNKVKIIQKEVDEPGWGQVQVEVKACGICAFDSYLFSGTGVTMPYPFGFGHEGVGIVRKVGPGVVNIKEGDNVFTAATGDMMAQIVNLPAVNVAVIQTEVVDYKYWVAEPILCVVNGLANIPIEPADHVVVIGSGYMGLLNIQALSKCMVGMITVLDVNERRLQLAKEFGADGAYKVGSDEANKVIENIRRNGGADIILECSGSEGGLKQAYDLLKTSGVLSIFAWHKAERKFDGTHWHLNGIRIFNTSPMIDRHFIERLKRVEVLVRKGIFNQEKLITHAESYHKAQELMELSVSKADNYIKGVITF